MSIRELIFLVDRLRKRDEAQARAYERAMKGR